MVRGASRQFTFGPCLGRGAFGEVYRATLRSPGGLDTTVAVKVLLPSRAFDADAIARLRDEGTLLARLNHPTIVKAHDVTVIDGRVALVTEYVEGADLAECVAAGLTVRGVLEALAMVADALDVAGKVEDEQGERLALIHRDIKAANVRVGIHGDVKLLDFGLARAHFEREARTGSNVILGTLTHVPPESFRTEPATAALDVYALGCTLFELVAGEPLSTKSDLKALARLAFDRAGFDARTAGRLGQVASPEVRRLLTAMLAYEMSSRPNTRDVVVQCEAIAKALSPPGLRTWCRDHAWSKTLRTLDGELEGREVVEGGVASMAVLPPVPHQAGPAVTLDEEPLMQEPQKISVIPPEEADQTETALHNLPDSAASDAETKRIQLPRKQGVRTSQSQLWTVVGVLAVAAALVVLIGTILLVVVINA